MIVLQINAVYKQGSTGKIAYSINNMLNEKGHTSYVAFGYGKSIEQNEYLIGDWLERKVHAVMSRLTGRQAHFSKRGTYKLLAWIDKIKPDIIHLHNLHSNYIDINILLEGVKYRNIPTVITLHDCWFYTGGCFHYTHNKCNKWKDGCEECNHLKYYFKRWKPDAASRNLLDITQGVQNINCVYITAVSEWIKEEYQKSTRAIRNVFLINNGVNSNVFKPVQSQFRKKHGLDDSYVILGPASKWLAPYNKKTVEYILDKIKGKDIKIVIFGCSDKQLKMTNFGTSTNIVKSGYLQNAERLAELYSMADVFVNLSWEDSFSLINVEAQMCGTPVVSYEACGAKETVNNEGLGAVVATNDYVQLVEEIIRCYTEGWKKNKNQIRKWVVDRFNEEYIMNEYLQLYEDIYKSN